MFSDSDLSSHAPQMELPMILFISEPPHQDSLCLLVKSNAAFEARVTVALLFRDARDLRQANLSNIKFSNEVLTRQQPFQMQQNESSFETIGRFELKLVRNLFQTNQSFMNQPGFPAQQNQFPAPVTYTQPEPATITGPSQDVPERNELMDTNQEIQNYSNDEHEFKLRVMKSENVFVDVEISKTASVKDLKVNNLFKILFT